MVRNFTYRKVHQMLKHMVLSQKKAARNRKCIRTAATGGKGKFRSFLAHNSPQ